MWYSISCEDKPLSLKKRMVVRPAHISRLEDLKNQGRLFVAGPHPATDSELPGDLGFTGSLIIAEFDSLDSAKEWAKNDPYMIEGVYSKVIVKPFKKVLP